MTLSKTRQDIGTTPHEHERLAVLHLAEVLPDRAPFHLFALKDLVEPNGRRYEIDAIVVAPRAVFVVEIKSHPAHFRGDSIDWDVVWKDGRRPTPIANPVTLTNTKAKVLASALERKLGSADRPHVQALVFLSDPAASIDSANGADHWVVTRHNLVKALTEGVFPGASSKLATNVIDTPRGERIVEQLRKLGLRNTKEARRVAGYEVGALLDDGNGWQDYEARSEQVKGRVARARVYLVPEASSLERREQLVRAAQREAELLNALSDHPNILHLQTFVADGVGNAPCLLFDRHEDEEDLESFLRRNPQLSFARRVELVEQVGNALAFCHRKGIIHRGLDPSAVMVRRLRDPSAPDGDAPLSVRLLNFQLATQTGVTSGTHHLSAFGGDRNLVYRAPEVLQDPRHASVASDVWSLGAIAYRVFAGRSPGANLAERNALLASGHLSLRAVRDDLVPPVDGGDARQTLEDVIALATDLNPLHRADNATDWVGIFLDVVTQPAPVAPVVEPDPLDARPDDILGQGLRVVRFLGSGATAKVFRVARDDAQYALKVALDAEHEDRLRAEADTLDRFHSDRIVALRGRLTLGGRFALLLDDAGESLADLLAREGAQSLDYARRWGDDLLLALEAIEEKSVQHRDIKPANLGVLEPGSKRRRHLMLFDFSLSSLDPQQVIAGTPAYRDPFLATRGRWDDHADRYAAAVSLHELVTGLRPRWGRGDGPVLPGDALAVDAERFDAAVRDRMVAFFLRALARDAAERFASAESMRHAWSACFVAPLTAAAPAEAPTPEAPYPALSDAQLAAVRADTALDALGLSARARNALDRSGIVHAAQLAGLSDNLLSSIRGIGRDTAREIQGFRQRLLAAPALAAVEQPEFEPGFRGDDVALAATRVPDALRAALDDAGIAGLAALAAAPRSQVEHLARPHGADALAKLRAALKDATDASERTRDPRTVEAWLDALFAPRQRHPNQRPNYVQTAWRWMGLDPELAVDPGDSVGLATSLGCTRQNVSLMLHKARAKWCEHERLPQLVDVVRAQLDALGGAARVDRVAEGLAHELPHDAGVERDAAAARRVEALVNVAAEIDGELVVERLQGRRWMVRDRRDLAAVRALGAAADALAAKSPLPSTAEVQEELARAVDGRGLAGMPVDRLVALAADASRTAAPSARLELYPRGMDARRALSLCHAAVSVEREGVGEEALRAAVRARYPEAEALPARPALDVLVADVLAMEWDGARARYRRPVAAAAPSTTLRSGASLEVRDTVAPAARPSRRSPEAQDAWEFDDALRIAARRGDWRVFVAEPRHATTVAERVAERVGATARSLDEALLAEIDAVVAERKMQPSVVVQADAQGPRGRDWQRLRDLAQKAAARVTERWTAEPGPLVVRDLGLAARFDLHALLQSLLDATRRDGGPAVFLVLPRYADQAGAAIDGGALPDLPVPTYSPAQRIDVPRAWIENRHRGEA